MSELCTFPHSSHFFYSFLSSAAKCTPQILHCHVSQRWGKKAERGKKERKSQLLFLLRGGGFACGGHICAKMDIFSLLFFSPHDRAAVRVHESFCHIEPHAATGEPSK